VTWMAEPEAHDFPAAVAYLSLLASTADIDAAVAQWRSASVVHQKAKDILRATRLALLPRDNPHVASDLAKIHKGHALSPVLLVRGDLSVDRPAQIADGYHRVCASYWTAENTDIPCLIAQLD